METLTGVIKILNSILQNYILIFALCGCGIYFTFKLRFIQIRKFGLAVKKMFGSMFSKEKAGKDGMSSFQALATAIAAQVGTGNLAGAATAIVSGGPGAIFWMWVSAFFSMATSFAESTLSQIYKTEKDGEVTGGPSYYIRAGFKGKFGKILAGAFSVFIIIALGFIGNMVQANSISTSFKAFGIQPWIIGVIISAISVFIFMGGVKRIASFSEKVVPFMAIIYIIFDLIILAINYQHIPEAFKSIFSCAFGTKAIAGGAIGVSVQLAIRYGVARGLFSNEAGMGSTPHAHAIAKVKNPCDQGVVAMLSVFIDTFIILTLTAITILVTKANYLPGIEGIQITQFAFSSVFGNFGNVIIAVCLLFFAFSSIVGWYFFSEQNIKYLFGSKGVFPFTVIVIICIFFGSVAKVDLVWSLADTFNSLMVIPNVLGLLALSNVVKKELDMYENRLDVKSNKLSKIKK